MGNVRINWENRYILIYQKQGGDIISLYQTFIITYLAILSIYQVVYIVSLSFSRQHYLLSPSPLSPLMGIMGIMGIMTMAGVPPPPSLMTMIMANGWLREWMRVMTLKKFMPNRNSKTKWTSFVFLSISRISNIIWFTSG